MKNTLLKINELLKINIIDQYAIAGGMAQFYYIEPSVTYDLDLVVHIPKEEDTLSPLTPIYEWAEKNNYEIESEHIIIEGIPVQFLLAYDELLKEALANRIEIKIFDVNTFILSAEYLMAIMLKTGRATDKERFIKFFKEYDFDKNKWNYLINKFALKNELKNFI